jgi:hypothetical protein
MTPAPFDCPNAVIISVSEEPGLRGPILIATIICPHCTRRHVHGVGTRDNPTLGHRLAHCIPTRADTYTLRSYVLVDPSGLLP